MFLREFLTAVDDIPGFILVKAGGVDFLFEGFDIGGGIIFSGAVFFEKIFGNDVHSFIGALSGEDGGDEEFQRIGEVERALGVGIGFLQGCQNFAGAGSFLGERFRHCL